MDADLSLVLNLVLLGALLLAWFAREIQESRRTVRACKASGGHYWNFGYVFDDRAFPHRWCTRCPAQSASLTDEVERI